MDGHLSFSAYVRHSVILQWNLAGSSSEQSHVILKSILLWCGTLLSWTCTAFHSVLYHPINIIQYHTLVQLHNQTILFYYTKQTSLNFVWFISIIYDGYSSFAVYGSCKCKTDIIVVIQVQCSKGARGSLRCWGVAKEQEVCGSNIVFEPPFVSWFAEPRRRRVWLQSSLGGTHYSLQRRCFHQSYLSTCQNYLTTLICLFILTHSFWQTKNLLFLTTTMFAQNVLTVWRIKINWSPCQL